MSKKEKTGTIKVELDLDEYFEGAILGRIENKLVANLTERIEERILKGVEAQVLTLCDAQFKKIAVGKIDEVFSKAHRKTNNWGEAVGEPISLREMLVERFSKYLDEKVDDKGNTSSYSGDKITRSQFMLNKLAHVPLQQAIDESVKGITAKAKEQIQASVSRYIADQLAPTISVPRLNAST